ncbi:aminotransferase class IV [Synoicihabitans lomoniglobus]|uniref:branched-chain-amino-acid transaminase n=1 Tax=Synoicihabitans lomoniglobus TaxID=2909285 RepID=A0AAF0I3R5_9BACT|nr:aminotransferase class IV [Opitutaceae bacterium LMO-M01]WED66314.1 aminotransferase class IV [Opitutaceae bacterium LMO-M01]
MSPLNRGYLYGDAIYEVWRSYHGVIFAWQEHGARLVASAKALGMAIGWSPTELLTEVKRTVAAFRDHENFRGEVYIRLQISRGDGAVGLATALADEPGFIILVQPVPLMSPEKLEQGLNLHIAKQLRRNAPDTLNPAWKTGNYLNNLLCLREARESGADDAVILNQATAITEASTSNIGFIVGGKFITPPLSAGILAGITRRFIIDRVAASAGLSVEERTVRPADLATIEEALLLSTTKDVQPVARIDEHTFAVGPDTATRRLKAAFAAFAHQHSDAHPELSV